MEIIRIETNTFLSTEMLKYFTKSIYNLDLFKERYFYDKKCFKSKLNVNVRGTTILKMDGFPIYFDFEVRDTNFWDSLLFILGITYNPNGYMRHIDNNLESLKEHVFDNIKYLGIKLDDKEYSRILDMINWYFFLSENEKIFVAANIEKCYFLVNRIIKVTKYQKN